MITQLATTSVIIGLSIVAANDYLPKWGAPAATQLEAQVQSANPTYTPISVSSEPCTGVALITQYDSAKGVERVMRYPQAEYPRKLEVAPQ